MSRKKKNIILGITITVVTVLACLILYFVTRGFNDSKTDQFYEIGITEFKNKIENKDSFILILEKEGCSHCESYIPVVKKVSQQYNIAFYSLDISKLDSDGATYLRNIANISGTPTTIFIYDGQEKTTTNRLVGEAQEYKLIARLKSEGYINE